VHDCGSGSMAVNIRDTRGIVEYRRGGDVKDFTQILKDAYEAAMAKTGAF
jgi:hypothetical protein